VLGEDDAESFLSMAVDGSFLYSSKLQGVIELWDLDTKQKLRVLKAHKGDVMTLQMGWGYLWSAGATGFARVCILLSTQLLILTFAEIQHSSVWQIQELLLKLQPEIPMRKSVESSRRSDSCLSSHYIQRPATLHYWCQ
jgi:WD40 repeat protein